jgi:hypothetical protein
MAEDIGLAALDLAELARSAGFAMVGYLLEAAALECGTEAVASRWIADEAET